MYDLSATDIDGYVADAAVIICIEYQVAGLQRVEGYRSTVSCLCLCCSGDGITKVQIYLLCETGAVNAACQAVAAVYIRIADKLKCEVRDLLSECGIAGCRRSLR